MNIVETNLKFGSLSKRRKVDLGVFRGKKL